MTYGLEWKEAAILIGGLIDYHISLRYLYRRLTILSDHPRVVTVFNRRAMIRYNDAIKWKERAHSETLVYWTRGAGPEGLAGFSTDEGGETRGRRLFLSVMLNLM